MNCYPIINQVPWHHTATTSSQTNMPFIVYIKNNPTLAFFAPDNAKYFNAKITENRCECGFYFFLIYFCSLRFSTLLHFGLKSLATIPNIISFQWGRQFSKNEAHTKESERQQESSRRGNHAGNGQMAALVFQKYVQTITKHLPERRHRDSELGTGHWDGDHRSLVCLTDISSIRMYQRAANVRRYIFGSREDPETISGSSN